VIVGSQEKPGLSLSQPEVNSWSYISWAPVPNRNSDETSPLSQEVPAGTHSNRGIRVATSSWQNCTDAASAVSFASACLVVLPFLFFHSALALRGNLLSPRLTSSRRFIGWVSSLPSQHSLSVLPQLSFSSHKKIDGLDNAKWGCQLASVSFSLLFLLLRDVYWTSIM
jgi:hypothetical protein